jgi:5'-phosphate synthase pdxT subunit
MAAIGVLALQGGFAAHRRMLEGRAEVVEVRRTSQLDRLDGLVLPGGESTTLLNLMGDEPWFEALGELHARGKPILATCAGMILLARRVTPEQPSLAWLDIEVRRNAWGRQVESFEADLEIRGETVPLRGVFIRAPRIAGVGPGVEVLARWHGEPVLVRQDRILAATFHPELSGDSRLHEKLIEMIPQSAAGLRGVVAPPPARSSDVHDSWIPTIDGGRAC